MAPAGAQGWRMSAYDRRSQCCLAGDWVRRLPPAGSMIPGPASIAVATLMNLTSTKDGQPQLVKDLINF
jgi:hypothetical protein